MLILELLARRGYLSPLEHDGDDLGGASGADTDADDGGADRGDDFTPTDDESDDDTGADEGAADESQERDEKGRFKAKDDADADAKDADDKGEADKGHEDKKHDKKAEPRIPKARFDEAVDRERRRAQEAQKRAEEAERRLAELSKDDGTPQKIDAEIEALEEKLDEAIADGNKDSAKAIRADIRKKQGELVELRAAARAKQATATAVAQVRYDSLVSQIERDFPQVNPDSEEFDQDLAEDVLDLKEAYEAKGLSSEAALVKAKKYILDPLKRSPKKDEDDEADADEEDAAAARKAAAVKKAADAAAKQPASSKHAGKDSDKAGGGHEGNVSKMSEEEWDALPEATKKRLRGDSL